MGKSKSQNGKGGKRPSGSNGQAAPAFDILTLEEAAALLRVTVEGLKGDAERGSVPGRLIGGEWRFARPTLWGWAKSPPVSPPPRRKLAELPLPEIPPEEYEAFRTILDASRDEVDRLTKSGKYAEDE